MGSCQITVNSTAFAMVPCWVIQLEGMKGNSGRIATYVALRSIAYCNPNATWPSERDLAVDVSEIAGVGPEAVRKHVRGMRQLGVITGQPGSLVMPSDDPFTVGTRIPTVAASGDQNPQSGDQNPHVPLSNRGKNSLAPSERKEAFERFWTSYPNAHAKPAAERAFRAAIDRGHLDLVRAGFKAHMATIWRDKEPQFIPYPQKWLNQRMYLEQCHVPGDPLMLPHRDAGKILYRADGSRFRREADGSATELPPEDES